MITIQSVPQGGYGLTEACGLVTAISLGGTGSHGRPAGNVRLQLFDEDGEPVAPGDVGEITLSGPGVMVGYHARPDLNDRFISDGWFRTGDLGRREHDGSLTFVGPKRRFIKSGNENVYPAEVETCLLEARCGR